jgi:hypothetical protein
MRGTLGLGRLGFFAAFTLTASGCVSLRPYDPGPGKRVVASVARNTYVSGESVNVTIANLSEVTLFYRDGACKTELQRRDGSSWKTVLEHSAACSIALPRSRSGHCASVPPAAGSCGRDLPSHTADARAG